MLDAADTKCDMGFLPDIRKIITHLPSKRQTLFFAATMPSDIRNLAKDILDNPTEVQIGIIAPAKTVAHSLYPITEKLKSQLFFRLIETTATGQVIVFTRTKHRTKRLFAELEKRKYNAAALQGNMSQNKRTQAINGFRKGKFDFLVATDIASRGIDIPEITHVINYDMPNTVDAYIHRIGRTGRAESLGEAITLSIPEDESMITRIEKILKSQIERKTVDDFSYGTSFDPDRRSTPSQNVKSQSSRNHARRSSGWKRRKESGTNRGPANAGAKSARPNLSDKAEYTSERNSLRTLYVLEGSNWVRKTTAMSSNGSIQKAVLAAPPQANSPLLPETCEAAGSSKTENPKPNPTPVYEVSLHLPYAQLLKSFPFVR